MSRDPNEFTPGNNTEARGDSNDPLDLVKDIDPVQNGPVGEKKEINAITEEITLLETNDKTTGKQNLKKEANAVPNDIAIDSHEDDSVEITFLEPDNKAEDPARQNDFAWGNDIEKNEDTSSGFQTRDNSFANEDDEDLGEIPLMDSNNQPDWSAHNSNFNETITPPTQKNGNSEIDLATLEFRCPFCTSKLRVAQSMAGRQYLCPYCFHKIPVPEQSSLPLEETDPSQIYSVDSSSDLWQKKQNEFISVLCPRCRSIIAVSKNSHNKTILCPDCEKEIDVEENLLDKYREMIGQKKSYSVEQPKETYEISDQWTPETAEKEATAQDDSFPVYCPVCHTMQYARPEQVGCTVKCPDCFFEFKVIRTREAPRPKIERTSQYEGNDSYAIEGESTSPSNSDENIRVICERCGTIVYQPAEKIGQMSRCPDCEHETLIRPITEEKRWEKEKIQPRDTGVYGVQQDTTSPSAPNESKAAPVIAASFTTPPIPPAPSPYDYVPMFHRSESSSSFSSTKRKYNGNFLPPYQKSQKEDVPPIPPVVQSNSQTQKFDYLRNGISPLNSIDRSFTEDRSKQNSDPPIIDPRKNDLFLNTSCRTDETFNDDKPSEGLRKNQDLSDNPFLENDRDQKDNSDFFISELSQKKNKKDLEREDGKIPVRRGDQIVYVTASPPKNALFNHQFRILKDSELFIKSLPLIFCGLLIAFLIYRVIFPNIFVKTTESGATVQGSASAGVSLILIPTLAVIFLAGIFWFGKMSQFMISIIQAGGSGARRVGEWLEEDFTGGFIQGIWLLGIVLISCIPSGIVSTLLKMQIPDPPWQFHFALGTLIFELVFPVIFLMTWQSGGGGAIRIVLGSLFHCFGSWLGFLFQTLLLTGIPLTAAVIWGDGSFGMILWLIMLVMIPPVYSALLGRLAWVIEDNIKRREED